MTARRVSGPALVAAALLAACELPEVSIPAGDQVVVVHAVMRPDLATQFVVIERSFDGATDPLSASGGIPPGTPRLPVVDALVTVSNLDFPSDPCSSTVFGREPPRRGTLPTPGVYWAPTGCPTMRPGDRLALTVLLSGGERITGTTRLPGMAGAGIAVGNDAVALPADSGPAFNRDRDTLQVSIEPLAGRLMQVELRRYEDLGDWGTLIQADTTALRLPGNLVDVYETNFGSEVFRAGRSYALTVALADTNYFDFARSRNNGITGRGFLNHLEGGLGVFGSMVATHTRIWVTGETEDPREGAYRIEGMLQGVQVDVTLTVYLARGLQEDTLSAFVDGQWLRLTNSGPDGTPLWLPLALSGGSVDGLWAGNHLHVTIPTPVPRGEPMPVVLRGTRQSGTAFALEVLDASSLNAIPLGSLTATQR